VIRVAAAAILALGMAAAESVTHRVQPGDTLYSIARKYNVSVTDVMRANGLRGPTIRAGQVLSVNGSAPAKANQKSGVTRAASVSVAAFTQAGFAVYYGGRADAETTMTAAHLTLPFGTWVRVTHQRTGRSVLVKINDRGPFGRAERIIDVSTAAARQLGMISEGVAPVTVEIVTEP